MSIKVLSLDQESDIGVFIVEIEGANVVRQEVNVLDLDHEIEKERKKNRET